MGQRFRDHFLEESRVAEELEQLTETAHTSIANLRTIGAAKADTSSVSLLVSIPGIGPAIAAILVSEIEDVAQFNEPQALIAYAGFYPKVRQSGIAMKRNTRITKRGSPYLRRAAYLAASIAQRHDADLKAYYEKKRSEGKRYKETTVANARHILNRVYAVWKRGTPYVKYPQHA